VTPTTTDALAWRHDAKWRRAAVTVARQSEEPSEARWSTRTRSLGGALSDEER
jgi:hypothetical protein